MDTLPFFGALQVSGLPWTLFSLCDQTLHIPGPITIYLSILGHMFPDPWEPPGSSPSLHFVPFVGMLLRREKKWGLKRREQISHLCCAQPDITGSLCPSRADGDVESSKDPVIWQGHSRAKGQRLNLSLKHSGSFALPLVSNESPKCGARDVRGPKWKGNMSAGFCQNPCTEMTPSSSTSERGHARSSRQLMRFPRQWVN